VAHFALHHIRYPEAIYAFQESAMEFIQFTTPSYSAAIANDDELPPRVV